MKFEIWMEGYAANGGHSDAHYVASVEAASFQEACDKHFDGHGDYNRERLSYWGCGLYDNVADARKSFG